MHLSDWLGEAVDLPFDEELFLEKLNERRAVSRLKTGTGTYFDTFGSY